jgi:hypothetical protein
MEPKEIMRYLLPEEIYEYFEVTRVKEEKGNIVICLDEKAHLKDHLSSKDYESKGFTPAVQIQDFPIRGRALYLEVRRRKWLDIKSGKIFTHNWELEAKGTKYTKEFGAFLKGLVGQ